MPTAAIVVIGDEILTGKFADENGPWLIGRLRALGCDVRRLAVVSDRPEDIADEVRRSSGAADHVITTGGVGPTHDDRTLEGVALAFGAPLVVREELAALLDRHGLERSPTNLRMVTLPEGASVVWTPGASFPVVRVRNVWVFPGIPPLMRSKFEQVASAFAGERVRTARLYTDAPETEIAALLFRVQDAWPSVAIGSYPRFGEGEHAVIVTLESRDDAALAGAVADLRAGMPVVGSA